MARARGPPGRGRHQGLRPVGGRGAHRGIQDLRQGPDARLRRAHGGARGVPRPRGGGGAPGLRLLPRGAQGRRAGGGQGSDHRAGRARGARGARRVLRREALRGHRGGARGVPRRRGAVPARALRRRARRAAGAGTGLQARARRRRRPEHRRHGELLARAGLRPRGGRGARATRAPADRRRAASPRNALPRHPLRGTHDDLRRPARARVQLPLRRSRDAGGAPAAAQRPGGAARGGRHARRPGGRGAGVVARTGP